MKMLILVRHAKSSWGDASLPDDQRPLNERGKKDAPEMARRLLSKKIDIDLFLSSPAKRALKTAKIFAEEMEHKKKDVETDPQLYAAGVSDFSEVIGRIDDSHTVVVVFSHNPGITEYANTLTSVRLDNMPTGSTFAVQADVNSWQDFAAAEKQFLFFDYPKNPAGKI